MAKLYEVAMLVESGNNSKAVRFEPSLYQNVPAWIGKQVVGIARANKCSAQTATMIACSSWGAFQLLGANIYALNWIYDIFTWCNDQYNDQYNTFTKFVAQKEFYSYEDVTTWDDERLNAYATFYNGPANVEVYAARLHAANVTLSK